MSIDLNQIKAEIGEISYSCINNNNLISFNKRSPEINLRKSEYRRKNFYSSKKKYKNHVQKNNHNKNCFKSKLFLNLQEYLISRLDSIDNSLNNLTRSNIEIKESILSIKQTCFNDNRVLINNLKDDIEEIIKNNGLNTINQKNTRDNIISKEKINQKIYSILNNKSPLKKPEEFAPEFQVPKNKIDFLSKQPLMDKIYDEKRKLYNKITNFKSIIKERKDTLKYGNLKYDSFLKPAEEKLQKFICSYESIESTYRSLLNSTNESEFEERRISINNEIANLLTMSENFLNHIQNGFISGFLKGHSNLIKNFILNPSEESVLVSCSTDKSVKVWDTNKKTVLHSFDYTDQDSISSMMILKQKNILVLFSSQKIIKFFSFENLKEINEYQIPVSSTIYSIIQYDNHTFITGSYDSIIRLYNFGIKIPVLSIPGHSSSITTLLVLKDSNILVSGSSDNSIKLWKIKKREASCIGNLLKHSWNVNSLIQLSFDKNILVSSGSDGDIIFWNLKNFSPIKVLDKSLYGGSRYYNVALLELKQNKVLLSGSKDSILVFWDLTNYECIRILKFNEEINSLLQLKNGDLVFNLNNDIVLWK